MKLSVVLGILGIIFGALFFFERKDGSTTLNPAAVADRMKPVCTLLMNKYYLDDLYRRVIVNPTLSCGRIVYAFDRLVIDRFVNLWGAATRFGGLAVELCDRLFIDGVLVNGSAWSTALLGDRLSCVQTGYIRQYVALMVFGAAAVSLICIWVF